MVEIQMAHCMDLMLMVLNTHIKMANLHQVQVFMRINIWIKIEMNFSD